MFKEVRLKYTETYYAYIGVVRTLFKFEEDPEVLVFYRKDKKVVRIDAEFESETITIFEVK